MNIVAVITNRIESYDAFIANLYPLYANSFRFIRMEDAGRLKGLPLPVMYTKLSLISTHHEGEEVATRLDSFAVPKIDPFAFTKDTPEISKFL